MVLPLIHCHKSCWYYVLVTEAVNCITYHRAADVSCDFHVTYCTAFIYSYFHKSVLLLVYGICISLINVSGHSKAIVIIIVIILFEFNLIMCQIYCFQLAY